MGGKVLASSGLTQGRYASGFASCIIIFWTESLLKLPLLLGSNYVICHS